MSAVDWPAFLANLDTRYLTLLVWGGGAVVLGAIIAARRLRAWRRWRDTAALREALEGFAVFICALFAAGAIAVALLYPTGNAWRTFLILASLGAFLGFEIIMATEPRRKKL